MGLLGCSLCSASTFSSVTYVVIYRSDDGAVLLWANCAAEIVAYFRCQVIISGDFNVYVNYHAHLYAIRLAKRLTSKLQRRTLEFSTLASWKKVSLCDSSNDRQPEMAAETGNAYISETMTDTIEISIANLGFTTIQRSKKVSASGCYSDRQPEIAIWPPKRKYLYLWNHDKQIRFGWPCCYFRLSFVFEITALILSSSQLKRHNLTYL